MTTESVARSYFTYTFAFPRRDAPEFLQKPFAQEKRAQGMPGAQCTHSLACKM
jgi:hypothetical protein